MTDKNEQKVPTLSEGWSDYSDSDLSTRHLDEKDKMIRTSS